MKEIEKLILQKLLLDLKLQKARMEYNNKYVFGSDDVFSLLSIRISELK